MERRRLTSGFTLIELLVVLGALAACTAPRDRADAQGAGPLAVPEYDGTWWVSAAPDTRSGFVEGPDDCFYGDYGGRPLFRSMTIDGHRDLISKYFQVDSARSGTSVMAALVAVRDTTVLGRSDSAQSPQGHEEEDGMAWRGLSAPEGRQGFIGGYLACLRHLVPAKADRYTKHPWVYADLIDRWYQLPIDTSRLAGQRASVPIATALDSVR